jgi:hypothetical protein
MSDGQQLHERADVPAAIERLARWWTSATQAERFALYEKAIHGEAHAPSLRQIGLAIYLAETEAGETRQG